MIRLEQLAQREPDAPLRPRRRFAARRWHRPRPHLSASAIILTLTTALTLLYFAWGIDSWRFSFVGDEYAFFDAARDIVARRITPTR